MIAYSPRLQYVALQQNVQRDSYPVVVNDLSDHSDVTLMRTGLDEHDYKPEQLSFA